MTIANNLERQSPGLQSCLEHLPDWIFPLSALLGADWSSPEDQGCFTSSLVDMFRFLASQGNIREHIWVVGTQWCCSPSDLVKMPINVQVSIMSFLGF